MVCVFLLQRTFSNDIYIVEYNGYDGYGILFVSLNYDLAKNFLDNCQKRKHYNYTINSYELNKDLTPKGEYY